MLKYALILTLLCGPLFQVVAQDTAPKDSTTINTVANGDESEEETNIFLGALGLIAISITIGIAAATFVVIMAVLLFVFLLIAGGVVSASIGVAIYRKSVASGVRALVFIGLGSAGAIGGVGLGWLIRKIFDVNVLGYNNMIVGGVTGLLGGLLAAFAIMWITRKLFNPASS